MKCQSAIINARPPAPPKTWAVPCRHRLGGARRATPRAKRQMDGFGGIVPVELKADLAAARRFLERCEVFALGIGEALVRLSVGIENVEDLRHDLARAPAAIRTPRRAGAPPTGG